VGTEVSALHTRRRTRISTSGDTATADVLSWTAQCRTSACVSAQWLGPRRITPNPLDISHPQLPHLDFVVISHNHYDHLDSGTVSRLNRRFGADLTW
jgi:phosphoribosyl 1,2-cyclic phosphodiesterase